MYYDGIKRRTFLQGIGASLALPFLPSLAPKAHAALGDQKNIIFITEDHGGFNNEHMYPLRNPGNEQILYSGDWNAGLDHRSRMEPLQNFLTSRETDPLFPTNDLEFSPILGSFLNPFLSKMNVVRGLDIMFYAAHHSGCFLGNFDGRIENTLPELMEPMETIDQVIANSSSFYASRPVLPIMQLQTGRGFSFARQSGVIQQVNQEESRTILNSILGSGEPVSDTGEMTRYLNAIHQDYQQLVNGSYGASRRLSSSDRLRVEEHVALLNELNEKIAIQDGINGSCSSELAGATDRRMDYWPDSITMQEKIARWENTTDIIAGAIKCGASRIINAPVVAHPGYGGDWHQEIAHRQLGEDNPTVLQATVENSRFTAENVFAKICAKLDVDRGDGSTYLDNTLVCWLPESGSLTHEPTEMFAVTAGSAGGYFHTGNYVDYRNLSSMAVSEVDRRSIDRRPGLPYNRWLYTMLKSMGVPDSEFAREGMLGYGDNYVHVRDDWYANKNNQRSWPDRLLPDMSTPMPRIVV